MENFFPPSFVILRKELKCGRTKKWKKNLFNPSMLQFFSKLFSRIKRVSYKNDEKFFNQRLREVGLLESANLAVGKYSGGMRRRMSVALSTIGDPRVILMDEPTTGLDPVSRRQVWDLIQSLKQGRVLIMTTHAMEEAELLSDKLAVLSNGSVGCVGTPL